MNATTIRRLAATSVLLLGASLPALAQVMGSSNRNAPKITQTIAFPNDTGTIELTYTSITWGEGMWAAQLADDATKAATRERINGNAAKTPMGSLKCSAAIEIGSQKVAAGSYKLEFTLDESYHWQLVLVGDAATVTCPLEMKTVEEERKRLHVGLGAGDKDFTAEIAVGFGKSRCKLPVTFEKKAS